VKNAKANHTYSKNNSPQKLEETRKTNKKRYKQEKLNQNRIKDMTKLGKEYEMKNTSKKIRHTMKG